MEKKSLTDKAKAVLSLVFNIGLSILTMVLVFTLAGHVSNNEQEKVSYFLMLLIISLILYQVYLFIKYPNIKDRSRLIIITIIYAVAAVFAFLAKNDSVFFFVSSFVIILAVAMSQVLRIFIHNKEKTKTEIFTNAIFAITLIALAVSVLININDTDGIQIVIVPAILILFITMKNLIMPSLKFSKVKIFLDILIKTHTIDVIICLMAMIITFSFLFPIFEDTITTYWDAMWYCFAVITTIGFGDFAATSLIGRILTVFLGIYGIVVVAIITSVIVNFYGAITKKDKEEEKYIE